MIQSTDVPPGLAGGFVPASTVNGFFERGRGLVSQLKATDIGR